MGWGCSRGVELGSTFGCRARVGARPAGVAPKRSLKQAMEAGPSGDDPALQVPLRVPRHRRSQTNLACPICGKTFGVDVIQAHADQCAAKQDRRSSGARPAACLHP